MAIDPTKPRLTYAAYLALPEGGAYNLLDGELVVTPAGSIWHQVLQGRLLFALQAWNDVAELGTVLGAPTDVLLREEDPAVVVQPDVLYVAATSSSGFTRGCLVGPPDLAVEVVSAGNQRLDVVRKRALYERYGVKEYWLVMPEAERVDVLRLDSARRFGPLQAFTAGELLESPCLPGFALPLTKLFKPQAGVLR